MSDAPNRTPQEAVDYVVAQIVNWLREETHGEIDPEHFEPREWQPDSGPRQVRFPCPRARYIGRDSDNPHQNSGTADSYKSASDHRAYAYSSQGEVVLKCQLCTNGEHGHTLEPAEYKAEIIDELGIEIGNVTPLDGPVEIRRHAWPCQNVEGTLWHIKFKKKKRSRTASWYWAYENPHTGQTRALTKFEDDKENSAKFLFQHSTAEEAGFYNRARMLEHPHATMVFCEGEKDADMAEELVHIARAESRFVGTAAAYNRISTGDELPGAFVTPFINKTVVSVFDRDPAGDKYRVDWPGAVWDVCQTWKDLELEIGEAYGDDPKLNDLTDWVEKMGGVTLEVAELFIRLLEEAPALVERPHSRDHWMLFPSRSDSGKPHKADADNGRHLFKYHPALRGVVRRHAVTGDIVTVGAPFTEEEVKVWYDPKRLGVAASWWLTEQPNRYVLGDRAFPLPMLKEVAAEAPPWSPHEELVTTQWDGTGRAEQLFIDYIPLDCGEEQARALGRMVMSDIARSLQGKEKALSFNQLVIMIPRDLMGLSLVKLILPEFSAMKMVENVKDKAVVALMRKGARLLQFPAKAVTHYQSRMASMEALQASSFEISEGDDVGAPALIFVGELGNTDLSDVPPTYIVEDLRGTDLQNVGPDILQQMVAEAISREAEWQEMPQPTNQTQASEDSIRERLDTIGTLLARYVFTKVEFESDITAVPTHTQVMRSPDRAVPKASVVTEDVVAVMSHYARLAFGVTYSDRLLTRELNVLYRWLKGKPNQKRFKIDVEDRGKRHQRSGVSLTHEQLGLLKTFLAEYDDEGGDGGDETPPLDTSKCPFPLEGHIKNQDKVLETKEEKGERTGGHSPSAHTEDESSTRHASHARASRVYSKGSVRPLGDPNAEAARLLLAEAGPCGIDFESFPGDPEYWVQLEDEKYKAQGKKPPAGWKTKLRQQIRFENCAPRRVPCIFTVAKPGGRKVWVRLPAGLTAARKLIGEMFATLHPDAELIAHNAVFESEVLAGANVYPDIHCTLVASKLIYAEAFAWDDDDDDAPAVQFVTGEEDVGIVDPVTGQLDLERLGPIGQPRYHSLKACMEREFGRTRDKTLRSINWASDTALGQAYVDYALEDAVDVLELWEVYEEALKALGLWEGYLVLIEALPAIGQINSGGLMVDMKRYDAYMEKLEADVQVERDKLMALNGIKPAKKNMSDAMKWWCVGRLWDGLLDAAGETDPDARFDAIREMDELTADFEGIRTVPRSIYWQHIRACIDEAGYEVSSTRGRRNAETDRYDMPDIGLDKSGLRKMIEFLDQTGIAPELLEYLRVYRGMNKAATLLSNLGEGFRKMIDDTTGRIVGHHQLAGAVTGRQTCRDVNLQQIPIDGDARAMFVAPKGRGLIVADYSQVELRVGAVVAEDDALFQVYVNGEDVHTATASKCFHVAYEDVDKGQRKMAKAVNFGCLYGAAGPAISESALCSLAEGEELLDRFLTAYPGIAAYRERASHETGDIWITPGRRVMATPEVQGPKRVNYPVQGGAASVQHRALKRVWDALRQSGLHNRVWLRAAIHDEIVVEYDLEVEAEALIVVKEAMTLALLDLYPTCREMGYDRLVSIEAGHDWSEKA